MPAEKSPAFQFYPKDFLSSDSVSLMTSEQVGAYVMLLCHAWLKPEGLPGAMSSLAKLSRVSQARFTRCIWPALVTCFQQTESGHWINLRLERERAAQEAHRSERSQSGKRGAATRWKAQQDGSANSLAIQELMAKNNSSSASSSASTTTSQNEVVVTAQPPPPRLIGNRNPDRMTHGPIVLWASWFRDDIVPLVATHFGGDRDAAYDPAVRWIGELDDANLATTPTREALAKPREWWKARASEKWGAAQSIADDPWLRGGRAS